VLCVQEEGAHLLFLELLKGTESETPHHREGAAYLIGCFCAESGVNFHPHTLNILRRLLELFNDEEVSVQRSAWTALDAVIKAIDKNELPDYVADVRVNLNFLREELAKKKQPALPGFCLPKVWLNKSDACGSLVFRHSGPGSDLAHVLTRPDVRIA
jgi:hypothetical protein